MSQEPIDNQDQQTSATSNKEETWSSPKGTGTKDFVKIDTDDLHPERIERLGQYLSDTTTGNTSNPDIRGGQNNYFPISSPESEGNGGNRFIEREIDQVSKRYFRQLSQQTSFEPGVAVDADGTYGSGHKLLQKKAEKIINTHIKASGVDPNSRWFGIGIEKFPPKPEEDLYQVQRSSDYLDQNIRPGANPKITSQFKDYRHKDGQISIDGVESVSGTKKSRFWNEYHERMKYVGAKITLGATGKLTTESTLVQKADDDGDGSLELEDATGSLFKREKQDLDPTIAGKVFMDDTNQPTKYDTIARDIKLQQSPIENSDTYGQNNSWSDPFTGGNTLGDNPDVVGLDKATTKISTFPRKKLGRTIGISDSMFNESFHKKNVTEIRYDEKSDNRIKETDWTEKNNWKDKFEQSKSSMSMTNTPSLFLLPKRDLVNHNLENYGLQKENSQSRKFGAALEGMNSLKGSATKDSTKGIKQKFQKKEENRFSPEQVRRIENQLEAEHLPFYIQDLRTNEIISFHAFLTSLSDAYSADWSAQKGFGRIEAAQIYGGGSRSIAVNFLVVPMNEEDFDEMYYKINKLTTLVYPQWSQGTMMSSGESTYVQPFSQVPTASPLCRIRVGDLFTSNYSDVAMARMMGVGSKSFKYVEEAGGGDVVPVDETNLTIEEKLSLKRLATRDLFASMWKTAIIRRKEIDFERKFGEIPSLEEGLELFDANPKFFPATVIQDVDYTEIFIAFPDSVKAVFSETGLDGYSICFFGSISAEEGLESFLRRTVPEDVPNPEPKLPAGGISSLFDRQKNPIMKSFNSTMGRGIAVAITGIGLDWKLNSVPWELKPGHRAPRMCEISLSLTPIHDITPGLDHEGVNRAPIYKVGNMSKSLTGDVWENNVEYDKIIRNIGEGPDAQ